MRIVLGLEYEGTGFRGWQRQQPGVRTVQAAVEAAVASVADHPVDLICAGRTDAGVHATAQVVHFDTEARRSERSWVLGTNTQLPGDVRVQWARPAAEAFHARFSARARSYRYIILNTEVARALQRHRVTWEFRPLREEAMAEGAGHLIGEHDFSSFRSVQCQAEHAVREVERLVIRRRGEYLWIDVTANAFLHHMVRNIAGVLMAVGRGERPPDWVGEVLAQRDRTRAGVTAPAQGLYLVGVRYPAGLEIPEWGPLPVFN
jgi:tRNA pseudouridine38-40 synthase